MWLCAGRLEEDKERESRWNSEAELHEGGQVADIEVLHRLDVSLTQDLLSIGNLFSQI